jgi:hypothetical protein
MARMIAATTPQNLRAELERMEARWRRGEPSPPRFAYAAPADHGELRDGLLRAAEALDKEGELGAIYAARARELAVEAEVCTSVGGPSFWAAARRRFARRDAFDAEADREAAAWLDARSEESAPEGAAAGHGEHVRSDGERVRSDDERDPRSLLARMRAAIGAHKLPLRLVVLRDLAPLAATGEGVIQVAAGRMLSLRDVERTVLHEIEGHALPSERARILPLSIFSVGTAAGSDDQEGRALAIERAAGFLDARRLRELALRHIAARSVEQGASFIDTADLLLDRGAALEDALRIAARVHRGGGLAREVVYVPALLRVEAARRVDPSLDHVLSQGRVSVDAARALRPWADP